MYRIRKNPLGARASAAVLLTVVASFGLFGSARAGAATTVIVDCAADATALANALASPSLSDGTTLAITGTCVGTFDLGHSLTLAAGGAGATLAGQATGPVLTVEAGQTVDVSNLAITGGGGSGSGARACFAVGGILNFGTLTLSHSSVSGNTATTNGPDFRVACGGIDNEPGATVILAQSSVTGNSAHAQPGFAVGGILNAEGKVVITNSAVSGNDASGLVAFGGIRTAGGTFRITNGAVDGNTAEGESFAVGGIANDSSFALTNSTVNGNDASANLVIGGIATGSDQPLTLTNSIVSGNTGTHTAGFGSGVGGIAKFSGTVTLRNSTVANNTPCDFGEPLCT